MAAGRACEERTIIDRKPMKSNPIKFLVISTILSLTVFCAFFPASALASDVEIGVSIDKSEITVGDPVLYTITLTWDPKVQVGDPQLEENLGALVVRERKPGKAAKGQDGRNQRTDAYTITSYQVGEYKIPPPLVRFTDDGGEAKTVSGEPVMLKVRSVAPEDAKDIRDIKPPRFVPRDLRKPMLYAGIGLAAAIALTLLIVYVVRRARRRQALVPPVPPFDVAIRRLAALEGQPRTNHEEMKAFYVELSGLLRDYLDGRFQVPAPLLTTSQLRAHLEETGDGGRSGNDGFMDVLVTADFVKFAKLDPSEETVQGDIEATRRFLLATKPPDSAPDEKPAKDAEEGAA